VDRARPDPTRPLASSGEADRAGRDAVAVAERFAIVEELALAHGRCTIVALAEGDLAAAVDGAVAALPDDEQARARGLAPARRAGFVAGRVALHAALGSSVPIGSDDRGAPILPAGWGGSVSHKGARAAALVAPAGDGGVGIDLELAAPPRVDIARRVLTARELAAIDGLADRGRAVTLRFSIKEAIYKAIAPTLRRYVGFLEVELELAGDAVLVTTGLPFAIEATWREHAGHWLTTARARPVR
jgi:4'-phosphopantetheinyl transferase EntD